MKEIDTAMTGFAIDSLTPDVKSTKLTDEQFFELCSANRDMRFERSADGELIIMVPTGWGTGNKNAEISGQFWAWNRQMALGKAFDSSTGFSLPNGADRSPEEG